jgi:hypothetical protein
MCSTPPATCVHVGAQIYYTPEHLRMSCTNAGSCPGTLPSMAFPACTHGILQPTPTSSWLSEAVFKVKDGGRHNTYNNLIAEPHPSRPTQCRQLTNEHLPVGQPTFQSRATRPSKSRKMMANQASKYGFGGGSCQKIPFARENYAADLRCSCIVFTPDPTRKIYTGPHTTQGHCTLGLMKKRTARLNAHKGKRELSREVPV